MGSGPTVDIPVQGTGVSPLHCHIENSEGVVTIYPLSENLSIDGNRITGPTRLSQGRTKNSFTIQLQHDRFRCNVNNRSFELHAFQPSGRSQADEIGASQREDLDGSDHVRQSAAAAAVK